MRGAASRPRRPVAVPPAAKPAAHPAAASVENEAYERLLNRREEAMRGRAAVHALAERRSLMPSPMPSQPVPAAGGAGAPIQRKVVDRDGAELPQPDGLSPDAARMFQSLAEDGQLHYFDDAAHLKKHLKNPDKPRHKPNFSESSKGFHLIRRASFRRRDSIINNVFDVPGTALHQEMADAAEKAHGDHQNEPNIFEAGVTITYRYSLAGESPSDAKKIANGVFQHRLPIHWNSSGVQTGGGHAEAAPAAASAAAAAAAATPAPASASATPAAPAARRRTKAKEKADATGRLTKNMNEALPQFAPDSYPEGGIVPARHGMQLFHSETAAASEPRLNALLEDAVRKFQDEVAGKQEVVVTRSVLEGESYPNTMCSYACRPAVIWMREKLGKIMGDLALPNGRLSGSHGTDSRVTAGIVFPQGRPPERQQAMALAAKKAARETITLPGKAPLDLEVAARRPAPPLAGDAAASSSSASAAPATAAARPGRRAATGDGAAAGGVAGQGAAAGGARGGVKRRGGASDAEAAASGPSSASARPVSPPQTRDAKRARTGASAPAAAAAAAEAASPSRGAGAGATAPPSSEDSEMGD